MRIWMRKLEDVDLKAIQMYLYDMYTTFYFSGIYVCVYTVN